MIEDLNNNCLHYVFSLALPDRGSTLRWLTTAPVNSQHTCGKDNL